MELQRLSVKFFVTPETQVKPEEFVPVFHSWIRNQKITDHLLIDVADYNHVPEGPGTLLVAHEGNYSIDQSEGKPGLLYQRKRFLSGTLSERLDTTLKAALSAAEFLEQEPDFRERLHFDRKRFLVLANDRLNLPNTKQAFETLRPALSEIATRFFGSENFALARGGKEKERLSILMEFCAKSGDRTCTTGNFGLR